MQVVRNGPPRFCKALLTNLILQLFNLLERIRIGSQSQTLNWVVRTLRLRRMAENSLEFEQFSSFENKHVRIANGRWDADQSLPLSVMFPLMWAKIGPDTKLTLHMFHNEDELRRISSRMRGICVSSGVVSTSTYELPLATRATCLR